MEKRTRTLLIVTGIVGGSIAVYLLLNKSGLLKNTGPSYKPPPPTTNPNNPSAGKSVYSAQGGLTIRTSPEISNGFLGMFGNVYQTVDVAGKYLGTYVTSENDKDSSVNPSTGQVYKWYQITLAPEFSSGASSSGYYVREDFATLK